MHLSHIEFVCSSPSLKFCPRESIPEFAFIGRSNVGKSSLINMLAGQKGLAKTSSTPGKTRLINHFRVESDITNREKEITDWNLRIGYESGTRERKREVLYHFSWFLVDLPGYGFAKLPKTEREKFEGMIRNYLEKRENLALTFLLIDSRLAPQRIDVEFMNWLGEKEIGFVILFTKTDKLSKAKLQENTGIYNSTLALHWAELPRMILTSSEARTGRDEVMQTIGDVLLEVS